MTKRGWEAAEGQVVAVKKNQPQLWDDIAGSFEIRRADEVRHSGA